VDNYIEVGLRHILHICHGVAEHSVAVISRARFELFGDIHFFFSLQVYAVFANFILLLQGS
jgi:hypothetical protein